jgi:hypothetical protein
MIGALLPTAATPTACATTRRSNRCEPRRSRRPCHPRARSSGHERYAAVSHGTAWHASGRRLTLGASNLPATAPRGASRGSCALASFQLSTCGIVMQKPAAPGARGRGEVFNTAEVTGSIPVTPTRNRGSTVTSAIRRRPRVDPNCWERCSPHLSACERPGSQGLGRGVRAMAEHA